MGFASNISTPLNYIVADDVNYRMVKYVKWENCFVRIGQESIVEIQKPAAKTQKSNDPAPGK